MSKHKSRIAIALALVMAGAAPAMAGMSGLEWMQKWQRMQARRANPPQHLWVSVRVEKVNLAEQMLTISHGAIKKINMPAMTMTFPVSDTTHLPMLRKGNNVDIHVAADGGVVKIVTFRMHH